MATGNSFFDRLIEHLDKLDSSSLQNYLLKLVRKKGFLETVFNTIREGIIVIDADIRIHYVNAGARTLLGLPENADGHHLDRYLKDVDWDAMMSADAKAWHRASLQEIEVFYPTHRILTFYVVPHTTEDPDGLMPMATIIFHDATESRRDTEETIASQKVEAITNLAAGVAHEIGNPLNSLTIHLQLLQRALPDTAESGAMQEAAELLDVALQEVTRLDSIVNNFLRAIRPAPPDLTDVYIQSVLGEALNFMRHEIQDRNIRVEAVLPDKLPPIHGDPNQLKQAFFNIMKNSIQSMADGGLLSIVCKRTDDFLDLRFADTGRGIASEDLGRIMEPYFTTRADGSGLGLLVVERVLRNHGAEFGIGSAPGEGTTFTIRFPLRDRRTRLLQPPETGQDTAPRTVDGR